MVFHENWLHCLRQALDQLFDDPGHFRLESDLLKLLLELVVVYLWSLSLRFLLVDLHSTVLVVHLYIFGYCHFAEVGEHGFALRRQL